MVVEKSPHQRKVSNEIVSSSHRFSWRCCGFCLQILSCNLTLCNFFRHGEIVDGKQKAIVDQTRRMCVANALVLLIKFGDYVTIDQIGLV